MRIFVDNGRKNTEKLPTWFESDQWDDPRETCFNYCRRHGKNFTDLKCFFILISRKKNYVSNSVSKAVAHNLLWHSMFMQFFSNAFNRNIERAKSMSFLAEHFISIISDTCYYVLYLMLVAH